MNFILDTSVTLAWCFADEATPTTDHLLERLSSEKAFVPSIWSLEVSNVLLMAEKKKRIQYADIIQFVTLLQTLPIEIDDVANEKCFHEILGLAYTQKLTTYDTTYLELAMRKGLPLASRDKDLCAAAKKLGIITL